MAYQQKIKALKLIGASSVLDGLLSLKPLKKNLSIMRDSQIK
jgi:hypothetical protein